MVTQERKPVRLRLFWAGAWAALAFSTAARADFVTPYSIAQPPPPVGPANYSLIDSSADLVANQYTGRGLLFPHNLDFPGATTGTTAAITVVDGVDVWAPAGWYKGSPQAATLWYGTSLSVQLVKPGTTTPMTATSVTVDVLHLPNTLPIQLIALDRNGYILANTDVSSGTGPHGGELLTVSAANFSSFQVGYDASLAGGLPPQELPWGVAGIGFTPSPDTAPEPGGLALVGVGAATLAGWTWRFRRNRQAFAA